MSIIEADLLKCKLQQEAHFNGGAKWFGYGYRCVEHSRLYRLDRYDRKTRKVESEWSVDGQKVAGLAEAVLRLNVPPSFTPEELIALREAVTDEWSDRRTTLPFEIDYALRSKGAIEWANGKCRRTDTGRVALRTGGAK